MLRLSIAPTGEMRMDDMRIALVNYIVSRQRDEQFILRIEDMDKEQNIEGKDQELQDILKKFAIEQDQLFYQSDNLGRHQQFAMSLLEQKKAFVCLCTQEKIEADEAIAQSKNQPNHCDNGCIHKQNEILAQIKNENIPFVIRIKKPDNDICFLDKTDGDVSVGHTDYTHIGSFVILDQDGTPTQDFAMACDDMMQGVSMLICSEKSPSDTPKHIHIQKSLGYDKGVEYIHIPAILFDSSDDDINSNDGSIRWLLEQGFLLDSIINYLLLIGNNTPQEIFTLPDAIKWLDLENISDIPEKFDIEKLRSINREHLNNMDDKELSKIFGFADTDIGKLAKLYLRDVSTIVELDDIIKAIFTPKKCTKEYDKEMREIVEIIKNSPMLDRYDDFKAYVMSESNLTEDSLSEPLQILMTGSSRGLSIADIYPFIKSYITEIARCES